MHYTTHGGRLHHFPWGPFAEEQVLAETGGNGFIVAKDSRAFDGAAHVWPVRFKEGICRVTAIWQIPVGGGKLETIYCRDELLPHGVVIEDNAPL